MRVPLHEEEGYSVEAIPTVKNQVQYVFYQREKIISKLIGKKPIELTATTQVAKQIKSLADPSERLNKKALKEVLQQILQILQEDYETTLLVEQRILEEQEMEEKSALEIRLTDAEKKLQELEHPLLWIGSVIDWLTAGERQNILLCFLAYSSQVILHNPISVIALGEAGSGKSHVEQVAMSLIPKEFIINEKKITEATLFRRAETNPHFYDGKIVNYGDMGGLHDHDFMDEAKNIMKELQSDGYVCKPLLVPSAEGGWETKDLELFGNPCLTYTTVPNHEFDEQELSRSIFITPRTDNRQEFHRRNICLEFKGKTYANLNKITAESESIKYMVYHLRLLFEDVEIINPYAQTVINFLNNSKYYKRDYPKYNNLLKVITALNYYKKEVVEMDGRKIIYTSAEDVQLFLTLLDSYRVSINENLSPKATEILEELSKNAHEWFNAGEGQLELSVGFTVNEYLDKTQIGLNKRSIQNYFGELNRSGFIKVVSKMGNTNVWELTSKYNPINLSEELKISDEIKEIIRFELGDETLEFLEKDKINENVDIMNHDENVPKPLW